MFTRRPPTAADLSAPPCVAASVEELSRVAFASLLLSLEVVLPGWSLTVDSGEAVDMKERCCLGLSTPDAKYAKVQEH